MSAGTKIVRLLAGTLLVVVIVVATFALLPRWIHTWGATEAEVARTLPGDELIDAAEGDWTHAKTIDAPPEEVWPWIAQLGDDRGGFYSYTFIETLIMGEDLYHNANRIRLLFILNGISGVFTLTSAVLDSPPFYLMGSLVFWCPVFIAATASTARLFNRTVKDERTIHEPMS